MEFTIGKSFVFTMQIFVTNEIIYIKNNKISFFPSSLFYNICIYYNTAFFVRAVFYIRRKTFFSPFTLNLRTAPPLSLNASTGRHGASPTWSRRFVFHHMRPIMKNTIIQKFADKTAKIGIVGLGYVGLPLMLRYVDIGYPRYGRLESSGTRRKPSAQSPATPSLWSAWLTTD